MSDTPELDKQSEIIHSGKAEIVQEFLDWMLDEKKWEIAVYAPGFGLDRLIPLMDTRQQIMAQFFEIDLDKIEEERRMVLNQIRNSNIDRGGA